MTDNSNFALRWEINNATASVNDGSGESEVFNEEGFEWKIGFYRDQLYVGMIDFSLTCNHPGKGEWKCRTNIECKTGFKKYQTQIYFTDEMKVHEVCWIASDERPGCIHNDKLIVEFRVKIISSELPPAPVIDLTKFSSPIQLNNVTLVIGDKKLLVSKDYLAVHSPVFAAMLFGDFAEKEKEEVELKEIIYEEFIDLLQFIYLGSVKITDRIVSHLLKLGDRFQMERVVDLSKKHLESSSNLNVAKKLMLADQYRLTSLKDHCLQSFTSIADLTGKLKSSSEFTHYSDSMTVDICRQIMKLNLQ
ncbi:hypothetical protein PRIPAC_84105 [Pristionchus pacificus]|uniref:BTB domain-containing protein n=1 Tax=Pristionchus pacificus TaxID=54126 RepID=A0A2A6CC60_PRIPA|nr:hypothetical protein PRIPAC_84105 [Pristionchus pacificus]|eukprot:PDM75792.1 BTB domain-containing protein [Pristionchus pacificus]